MRIVRAEAVRRRPRSYGISAPNRRLRAGVGGLFLEGVETVAHLYWSRVHNEGSILREEREIRAALYTIAAFSLGFVDRGDLRPTFEPMPGGGLMRYYAFDTRSQAWESGGRVPLPYQPLILDRQWMQSAREYGLSSYLRSQEDGASGGARWQATVRRSVMLAGQSMLAARRHEAFLLDMIALETLLTVQGDRFPGALLERLMALLGWVVGDRLDAWKASVERIYELRCSYVHDGALDDVTAKDLHVADTLLVNVVMNIVRNTHRFCSKQAVIEYAEELGARRVLGLRMRDRRMRLRYIHRPYTAILKKRLEDDARWRWL